LTTLLETAYQGVGCPVEIEFSANLNPDPMGQSEFALLQIRPMTAKEDFLEVDINAEDIDRAFCYSVHALGNTVKKDLVDIVFVKPDVFDPGKTEQMVSEIARLNATLVKEGRKYLLVGPGRWGSADRWLGIPVSWADISGVGAMVETKSERLVAEPSQGSHFFHNITTLGINYISVSEPDGGRIDWDWLSSLPRVNDGAFIAHVRLDQPITLKVDGRASQCVIFSNC
jgi:hypothetical protein